MRSRWEARKALEARAASILEELSSSTRGRTEDLLSFDLPSGATLEDAGSRINLNWISARVLSNSPPILTLFTRGSPEELQAYRRKVRFGTMVGAYDAFFDPNVLHRYFTAWTPMNVNTVDEFAFENIMAQAMGDASARAMWRERLREKRLSNTTFRTEAELRTWFGTAWDRVSLFVTTIPEWNANTIDQFLLGAVLACSDFALSDPASAASAIVTARKQRYLSDSDLRTIIGLPQENPIWMYLGSESSAWTLIVSDASGLRIEVDFTKHGETEAGAAFKIQARRWSNA
jgi:hypothetical protein